jgi:preprotein translocase subunit SecF
MKYVRIFDPKTNLDFVKWFKVSWILTAVLIVASVVGLMTLGMPWGIDFLGGTEMQVKFEKPVSAHEIRKVLGDLGFDKNQIQQFGASANNEMLVRIESVAVLKDADLTRIESLINQTFPKKSTTDQARLLFDKKSSSQLSVWLDEPYDHNLTDPFQRKTLLDQQRQQLARLIDEKSGVELRKTQAAVGEKADIYGSIMADEPQNGLIRYVVHFAGATGKIQRELEKNFGAVEIRKVDFVDSQVSRQLRSDGLLAVIYAILAIVIYIAIRFDMFFSPGAVFSLVNDTLGALIVFIFFRVEFDVPSIAAILTIIGYSVNNTVVIYDRIREILPDNPKKPLSLDEIKVYVNKAINETLSRTINSTLTTLFASVAIWSFTTGSIQNFAIVLSVGITVGAFSSAFVAPAAFLLAKQYLRRSDGGEHMEHTSGRLSREDRAKGVV